MSELASRAIAVVGVGAILPDALSAPAFWQNIRNKRYCISETPPERWSVADYYDPDPNAPDKTYSKIGGWVRGFEFDWKKYRIPPKVAAAMDDGQKWAVTIAAEALADYGYPERPLDTERTAVILGTAMGGELHYITTMRIQFPEYRRALENASGFNQLPADVRAAILAQWHERLDAMLPPITEDTMPGELPNIVSGRVANVLNLRGASFITDAACASSFAALNAAVEMLASGQADAVVTGGVDRNMGASIFVKFCKIGALSATGSRPFGDGADGFVMGEGSAAFLLKRLTDAERDGDKIYAVIRGVGGSSDGKGKGITAPNPIGQILAAERAWANAGLDPATATLVEAHGTSTKVGDVVELESLGKVFGNARQGSIALGSAKGNIGHLKAGAGAAGLLKAVMAVHDKVLPPTLNAEKPNPNADMAHSPFFLNHELQPWPRPANYPRRAGVSSYGFGGTNFHVVLEEYVPGMLHTEERVSTPVNKVASTPAGKEMSTQGKSSDPVYPSASTAKAPIRGILAIGAATPVALKDKLDEMWRKVEDGWTPPVAAPAPADIAAPERLVIDFGDHNDLHDKLAKARKAAGFDNPQAWKALAAQGIFRGSGKPAGKIAFLFPGQGSQYTNMGRALAEREPVVAETFKEADAVMTPILGRSLTSYIFVDSNDPAAMKQAERDLMQTAITQPAMLTADTAFYKLLAEYGFRPDMVMGHSLGEYGALIAADIMPFAHALEASAARGAEMTKVSMDDNGWMAAVMAPYGVIEQTLAEIDGYVVAANINSKSQAVVGGASKAVEQAIERFTQKGFQAMRIPVSHAFHTRIVAPASKPLRKVLDRLSISAPALPLVANVTGELYPTTVEGIKDILELQIASPVQWVKGLETMYREGCRVFVEVGPKKALKGFVDDVLGSKPDVVSLFTNHPKTGELASFNQTLCGLYAAGFGVSSEQPAAASVQSPVAVSQPVSLPAYQSTNSPVSQPVPAPVKEPVMSQPTVSSDALGQLAQVLQQLAGAQPAARAQAPYDRNEPPLGSVVISGTGLGLPGPNKPLMDPDNALRILRGEQFIDLIPERFRQRMLDKRITRLVKSEDGGGSFQVIADPTEVLRLAGRAGSFDLTEEYGVPAKLVEALDITTQYCFAAGLDALREAGIPLVQTWRKTTTGKYLPDRWMLPEALRDETGVIFASAFPGGDRFSEEFARYYAWENRRMQLAMLEDLRGYTNDMQTMQEINRRITELREQMAAEPYEFDRRFVFRILAMGHSQFAEYIGARGPNTHVNAACASTAQGVALAEDWIRSGRCRRVLVLGGDDVTSDNLMEWVGSGFLALGASATDDRVEEAALPFDRRRHGTILGMGACALAVESEDAVRERGMRGIVELLSSETANSAYHGSRLDVNHISQIMESLVASAERRFGLNRYAMAGQTVFISHETYTPARGGSASAEVIALRNTFGAAASDVVVSNTKGFTGHPMGVGVEDVIAVKILEYGIVPPVPNFKEVDPDLGVLNLSRGGRYPVQFALHLAAGFGSQISLTLTRRIPGGLDRTDDKLRYQYWLDRVSGYDRAELEVVKRNLRVKSQDGPGRTPAPSVWRFGYGPAQRAAAPGDGRGTVAYTPQPMPAVRELLGKPAVSEPTVERAAPVPMPAAAPAPVAAPAPAAPKPAPAASPAPKPAPAPAAPPAPAPVAAAVPAPVAPVVDPVVGRVLGIVAEKTGYPQDMLDLDLDLEADLGIDTVKQAETFQAVREAFGIPQQEGISLRDYPTLERVIGFVRTMRPDLAAGVAVGAPSSTGASGLTTFAASGASSAMSGAPTVMAASSSMSGAPTVTAASSSMSGAPTTTGAVSDGVTATVLGIVAEKTGYPQDMLDLDLDLEADLGIDTVKQAETFQAVREAFGIPQQEGISLRDYPTLERVIGFVRTMRPDLAAGVAVGAPSLTGASGLTGVAVGAPSSTGASGLTTFVASGASSAMSGAPTVTAASPAMSGAPTVTAAPSAMSGAPTTTGAVSDGVTATVLGIVAEKTGYPEDMLELDLDLEADLGVDTVKQAETFMAVREAFGIPAQENLSLRDYPTLQSVIGFVYTMRPDLAAGVAVGAPSSTGASGLTTFVASGASSAMSGAPTVTAASPAMSGAPTVTAAPSAMSGAPTTTGAVSDGVTATVLGIVAEKTGYPEDMLELDLDLEADLGVDTVKQAETFMAVREAFGIPVQENLSLRDYPTLQSVIGFVYTMRPDLAAGVAVGAPSSTGASGLTGVAVGAPSSTGASGLTGVAASGASSAMSGAPTVTAASPAMSGAPTVTAAPSAMSGAPTTTGAVSDGVTATVLGIVAEKTGYPEDMLELDLDLEADLGVDTVKQAETFMAVREAFGIPVRENLSLRDYPTLQSVIGFVYTMRPDLAAGVAAGAPSLTGASGLTGVAVGAPSSTGASGLTTFATSGAPSVMDGAPTVTAAPSVMDGAPTVTAAPSAMSGAPTTTGVATGASVKTIGTLEDADKMPRRVPQPSLRPALDLCKPTGVTFDSASRVVVMLDRGGIGKSLVNRLEKLGATVLTLEPGIATDALDAQLKAWLADGPIQGVYWLPALDVEAALEDMSLDEWRENNRIRVKNLYTAMRALYDSVRGPNSFLVSATRLGGLHGYGPTGASAPMGGAVVGFTKAYNMEQSMRDEGRGIVVKAVDFEPGRKTAEPADTLIAETLSDPGIVEVGYQNGLRYTVTLVEKPARDGQPGMTLDKNTVFVVTGAAGGITSAITTDLAVASGGVFYLLDLVACPERDDKYVQLFRQGRDVLKNALIAEAKASGEKVTPKQIDDKMMGIERNEAALRAVEAVEAAGGVAHYYSLDLRDGDKLAAVVDDIRQRYGKIDVLLHAGGLLIDRVLPNKEPHQFALVFDVKADGFFGLLKAAKGMPIGATVSFSSVAGRFGNNGQSDYSSANDLLCKISSSMRTWRPETRGIAIDWTAWGQIGMASRGSVQQILESLGVDMLPPESGVPTIRRELTYGGTKGEIVVAGRLGAWLSEKDVTGGADVDKINAALAACQPKLLMVGEVEAVKLYGGIEAETTLDPRVQPFLFDHAPDAGTPWLPGVMATEALAELATVLAPGYRVAAVENEQMMGAFKFFRMEPRTLYLSATISPAANGDLIAHATLRSMTKPAKEGLPVQVKEHFIADVRLTTAPAEKPSEDFQRPDAASLPISAAEIYQSFFHGPAYQVIERAGVAGNQCVALMADNLGPNTEPADVESLMAPRLVELCFQAAALWHVKTHGAMAFPLGFVAATAYRQPAEADGRRLTAVVETTNDGDTFDCQVLDDAGNVFVTLLGYNTVSRPG